MRKIINGKAYDTSTAELLFEHMDIFEGNLYGAKDLYRKKTGEYFLNIKSFDCNRFCGEYISPLTLAEAREFGESCMGAKEYEPIFGKVGE